MSRPGLYFYLLQGKVTGPVSFVDVKQMLESGELTSMELLYEETEKKWKAAGEFKEFFEPLENADETAEESFLSTNTPSASDSVVSAESSSLDHLTEQDDRGGLGSFGENGSSSADQTVLIDRESSSSGRSNNRGDEWVILKKDPEVPDRYMQMGPFKSLEVSQMIARGEVGFRDFVWRDGYTEWVLLADEEEFREKVSLPNVDIPSANTLQEASLESVTVPDEVVDRIMDAQTVTRPEVQDIDEEIPEETDGVDILTRGPHLGGMVAEINRSAEITDSTSLDETERDGNVASKFEGLNRTSNEVDSQSESPGELRRSLVIGLNLLILSTVLSFVIYSSLGPSIQKIMKSWSHSQDSQVAESKGSLEKMARRPEPKGQLAPETKKAEGKVATRNRVNNKVQKPKSQLIPKISATYLKFKPVNLSSSKGRLDFFSDGSSHFVLKVQISGIAGRGLYPGAFYRSYRVPMVNKRRSLELAKIRLPKGRYKMRAFLGDVEVSANLFWGSNDKRFREKRWIVRKQLSPQHQQEKLLLLSESEVVLNLAKRLSRELNGKKKSLSRGVSREVSKVSRRLGLMVSRKRKRQLLWPENWQRLSDSVSAMKALDRELRRGGGNVKAAREQVRIVTALKKLNLNLSLF